jgi:hypothetical protein
VWHFQSSTANEFNTAQFNDVLVLFINGYPNVLLWNLSSKVKNTDH